MRKNMAFTLAEILITLSIIGVVAMMVIPQAMENVNDRMFNDSASLNKRKFEG